MNVEEARRRIIARQRGEKPEAPPIDVYQNGELVGTLARFPPMSTSWLFDIRPGDFTLSQDGSRVDVASTIMPGDFEALRGFVPCDR